MRYELYYAEKKPVHMILKEMSETMCDGDLMKFVEDRCCDKRTLKDGSPLDIDKLCNDPDMELVAIIDKGDYLLPLIRYNGYYNYKDGADHVKYCQDMKILVYEIFNVRISLEFNESWITVVVEWLEGDFQLMTRGYKFSPTLDKVAMKDLNIFNWGDQLHIKDIVIKRILSASNKKISTLDSNCASTNITKFIDLLTL